MFVSCVWQRFQYAKRLQNQVPFFLLSTVFCWSHGSCPGQYKDKVICDSFCVTGRIFSFSFVAGRLVTSTENSYEFLSLFFFFPISILSNTDEESVGHPFLIFIFPYSFYRRFWYHYSTTQLSVTVVWRLQSQVIVLWPHLWVNDSHQLCTLSSFLLHLLNHSIIWLLQQQTQHPLISSFVNVTLSTCFNYFLNPSRFKRLRRNNGAHSGSFSFVYLFVFQASKLSCSEVSWSFSPWSLIGKCLHNWSIMSMMGRCLPLLKSNAPGHKFGWKCDKALQKLLVAPELDCPAITYVDDVYLVQWLGSNLCLYVIWYTGANAPTNMKV